MVNEKNNYMILYVFIDFVNQINERIEKTVNEEERKVLFKDLEVIKKYSCEYLSTLMNESFLTIFKEETKGHS